MRPLNGICHIPHLVLVDKHAKSREILGITVKLSMLTFELSSYEWEIPTDAIQRTDKTWRVQRSKID